ncbi:MAG: DivIVA domain-containing protein [Actinobacteria bacterium]|nr:DivIVA domain-containing protein [Actinomycetota bacterium]
MALTPDDIVNYPLKQSLRGYSISQVDELLDQVADELERMRAELEDRDRRLARAEHRADELEETEATLRRTLVTAQRAAEDTIEEARQRAEELIEDARREAAQAHEEALREARRREEALRRRYERLRGKVAELEEYESTFRDDLRSMLQQQLEQLRSTDPRPAGDVPATDVVGAPGDASAQPAGTGAGDRASATSPAEPSPGVPAQDAMGSPTTGSGPASEPEPDVRPGDDRDASAPSGQVPAEGQIFDRPGPSGTR